MDCFDSDPTLLHPISFFLSMLDGADDVTERGIDIYERCSKLARLSGLRDFDGWLRDATLSASARALKKKQVLDIFRILGHMDGSLTTTAQQTIVRELWHGGATDMFTSTLGELYTLRQVQRADMATAAATALGMDPSNGFLYLAQVPHFSGYRRVYDGVVILRRADDLPSMTRIDIDPDIVMRIETKWYLDAKKKIGSKVVREQVASDLVQSFQRDLFFRDLYYSLPADGAFNLQPMHEVVMDVWDHDVYGILEKEGVAESALEVLGDALKDHLEFGNMVFVVPDLAD
ncbi:MAG TPA: hypothetical protein VFI19_01780 [Nocardioides sp.]|nr:hypothetical protein [Nocardioides sp.]